MKRSTKLRTLTLMGLIGLFCAFPALLAPTPAHALGLIETDTFYSDATYTLVVGRCVERACGGGYSFTCTGSMTDFVKATFRIC
jgi:hypothetical protein